MDLIFGCNFFLALLFSFSCNNTVHMQSDSHTVEKTDQTSSHATNSYTHR